MQEKKQNWKNPTSIVQLDLFLQKLVTTKIDVAIIKLNKEINRTQLNEYDDTVQDPTQYTTRWIRVILHAIHIMKLCQRATLININILLSNTTRLNYTIIIQSTECHVNSHHRPCSVLPVSPVGHSFWVICDSHISTHTDSPISIFHTSYVQRYWFCMNCIITNHRQTRQQFICTVQIYLHKSKSLPLSFIILPQLVTLFHAM